MHDHNCYTPLVPRSSDELFLRGTVRDQLNSFDVKGNTTSCATPTLPHVPPVNVLLDAHHSNSSYPNKLPNKLTQMLGKSKRGRRITRRGRPLNQEKSPIFSADGCHARNNGTAKRRPRLSQECDKAIVCLGGCYVNFAFRLPGRQACGCWLTSRSTSDQ